MPLSDARPGPAPFRWGFTLLVGVACGLMLAGLLIPATTGTRRIETAPGERSERAALPSADSSGTGTTAPSESTAPTPAGGTETGPVPGSAGEPRNGPTGGPTGGGGGGAGGGGGGGDSGPDVQGVSDDKIRIGVALPDLGPFAAASEEFDIGDVKEQFEAVLDRWSKEGAVPVHGRDVEFIYREFSIFGTDEETAACNAFAKDDKVFMVIGMRSFNTGAECLTTRFQIPVVSLGNHGAENDYERRYPYHFTMRSSLSRIGRNFVHWAERQRALEGATIGLYWTNDRETNDMAANIKSELNALGYELAAEAQTNQTFASQQDAIAVQRFRQEGVDLAILMVSTLPASNFMSNAEGQMYRPTYIDNDYGQHTTDAASSTFSEEQYAGTLAMTESRTGEIRAGTLHPKAEACLLNYERYSGKNIPRESPESAELANILQVCDEAEPVLHGLQQAGRELTRASFIGGLETFEPRAMAGHGSLSFSSQKRQGADQQRTIQWQGECGCWEAVSEFSPFPAG